MDETQSIRFDASELKNYEAFIKRTDESFATSINISTKTLVM